MNYKRMAIEVESPEQLPGGYGQIMYNLAESSVTDKTWKELSELINLEKVTLAYTHHVGHPEFRELLAKENHLNPDDFLLTSGAASALFLISTALLPEGAGLLVLRPNYSSNIETPRALRSDITFHELTFEEKWRPNLELLKKQAENPKIKVISITTPHNPTGTVISRDDLIQIVKIAKDNKQYLIVDETYKDMVYDGPVPPLAATLGDHVISVSSLSKTYGLPGIRLGWVACQDKKLMETLLAAKEQMYICNPILDEEIAYQFYLKKEIHHKRVIDKLRIKREIVAKWMNEQDIFEWHKPEGGCVGFPRFKNHIKVDTDKFYKILNSEKLGTYVGPGHWFEQSDRYFRLGFGWDKDETKGDEKNNKNLEQGLRNLTAAAFQAIKETATE
eukprot:TRINITY_DN3705_c0_g1_i1.p1 TRINITY_DN3705_c0_g1~~TRINITY_DN3705_c0_g1_i1.p1  ORF type:complete len:390 (-),score=80.45 TRINITY_DN3705_c0_g1_i1:98-1267(-)